MLWAYFSYLAVPDHLVGQPAGGDPLVPRAAAATAGSTSRSRSCSATSRCPSCCCSRATSSATSCCAASRSFILCMRLVDLFWLVAPAFRKESVRLQLAGPRRAGRARRHLAGVLLHAAEEAAAAAAARSAPARRLWNMETTTRQHPSTHRSRARAPRRRRLGRRQVRHRLCVAGACSRRSRCCFGTCSIATWTRARRGRRRPLDPAEESAATAEPRLQADAGAATSKAMRAAEEQIGSTATAGWTSRRASCGSRSSARWTCWRSAACRRGPQPPARQLQRRPKRTGDEAHAAGGTQ